MLTVIGCRAATVDQNAVYLDLHFPDDGVYLDREGMVKFPDSQFDPYSLVSNEELTSQAEIDRYLCQGYIWQCSLKGFIIPVWRKGGKLTMARAYGCNYNLNYDAKGFWDMVSDPVKKTENYTGPVKLSGNGYIIAPGADDELILVFLIQGQKPTRMLVINPKNVKKEVKKSKDSKWLLLMDYSLPDMPLWSISIPEYRKLPPVSKELAHFINQSAKVKTLKSAGESTFYLK